MIRYHLTIKIFNDFFEKKLDSRGKIYSVWFEDYDILVEKIFHDLDWSDINKFKLNLFNCYKDELGYCRCSKIENGDVRDGYMIPAYTFNVTSNVIALCIPSRKIRDKYFEYDGLRERFFLRPDFIFYLKS